MNSTLIYVPITRAVAPMMQRPLIEEISRPKTESVDALVEAVDEIIREVYEYAFLETHSQRQAERITTRAVERISAASRRGATIDPRALRLTVVDFARREVLASQRAEARRQQMHTGRATLRHLMLSVSAVVAAVYAGVVIF